MADNRNHFLFPFVWLDSNYEHQSTKHSVFICVDIVFGSSIYVWLLTRGCLFLFLFWIYIKLADIGSPMAFQLWFELSG